MFSYDKNILVRRNYRSAQVLSFCAVFGGNLALFADFAAFRIKKKHFPVLNKGAHPGAAPLRQNARTAPARRPIDILSP
jgi:hypothetical protein